MELSKTIEELGFSSDEEFFRLVSSINLSFLLVLLIGKLKMELKKVY